MNGCIIIKYDETYNQYTYQYKDESCSEIEVNILPIITLNGDKNMTIFKGETFNDPGYTATYRGIDITSSVQVSGNVNTSAVDTYILTYTVNYEGKHAKSVTRTIKVIDPPKTFTEVMEPLLGTEVSNNDPNQNLRYVGSNTNNYVKFNNELWRIIGVFDGQAKIIRDEEKYSSIQWHEGWGTEFSSITWENAEIKSTLNTIYLNEINETSLSYIDQSHIWYTEVLSDVGTRDEFYEAEKGTTTWEGALGLLSPSDYGYSTRSESTNCNLSMFDWKNYEECYNNSWIYDSNNSTWTIIPWLRISGTVKAVAISYEGSLMLNTTNYVFYGHDDVGAKPVAYLKPNVIITSGSGTSGDPYILDIE